MSLQDDILDDLNSIYFDAECWGVAAIYTPVAGGTLNVTVIMDFNITRQGYESVVASTHDEITFANESVPTPKRGDRFAMDAGVYELISPLENDSYVSTWVVNKV